MKKPFFVVIFLLTMSFLCSQNRINEIVPQSDIAYLNSKIVELLKKKEYYHDSLSYHIFNCFFLQYEGDVEIGFVKKDFVEQTYTQKLTPIYSPPAFSKKQMKKMKLLAGYYPDFSKKQKKKPKLLDGFSMIYVDSTVLATSNGLGVYKFHKRDKWEDREETLLRMKLTQNLKFAFSISLTEGVTFGVLPDDSVIVLIRECHYTYSDSLKREVLVDIIPRIYPFKEFMDQYWGVLFPSYQKHPRREQEIIQSWEH